MKKEGRMMTHNNAVLENIRTRRSIRSFTDRAVEPELLETIAEAGQYAPTGMNRQDLWFLVSDRPELIRELSNLNADVIRASQPEYKGDPFFHAPALIAVLADRNDPNWIKNGSLAMQNMMLAAHSLGLGTCWINRADAVFDSVQGRELLSACGIPQEAAGVGFCIVGYPAEEKKAAPRTSHVVKAL